ncbi:MAG: hypothetical protein DRH90_12030 [Deltaproteobacteria bacterium]|nr:MAG: hypothetical protein DRH90_12030 [Deltaproteobacteria bacterium]
MSENKVNALIRRRSLDLQEKRQSLLGIPAEQVVEKIMAVERPAELVHSFPEEDLYLLVNEIGLQDALPILSLASVKQWDYILDMDIWDGDTVDPLAATKWFSLLMAADPDRFSRWCADEKQTLTEFFLYRNIDVGVREDDQDVTDFGPEFATIDDVFYFRVKELPTGTDSDGEPETNETIDDFKQQRMRLFPALLHQIATNDYLLYRNLLMETVTIIPAETEEELYRLRNVRLAEKGFLPQDEAVGVYQPLEPRDLPHRPAKYTETASTGALRPPVPLTTGNLLGTDTLFGSALAAIDQVELKMQLQAEFAGLCNNLVIADHKKVSNRQDLGEIVKKACGFISIGLENLSEDHRQLISTYPLSDVFRVGYGQALALKWKTEAWQKESWYLRTGLRLSFWGETFMGVLGGLLIQKPLFFDNYATGIIYREFQTAEDLRTIESLLDRIMSLDKLFDLQEIEESQEQTHPPLTYKNLLLTMWAAHCRGSSKAIHIPLKEFKTFFTALWDSQDPPAIKTEVKTSFAEWIAATSGLDLDEISSQYGTIFTELFKEIEREYAQVVVDDLDPRFIHMFRVVA